jgi:hypothetical protein
MNKGIVKTNGEYLLFLNSGDELYSNDVLDMAFKELHTDDLVCFDLIFRGERDKSSNYPNTITLSYFWEYSLGHPSVFIKRNLFDKLLYDVSLKIVSDWKFLMIVCLKLDASYRKVNFLLSVFYMDGISCCKSNVELIYTERQLVLKSEFTWLYPIMTELNTLKSTMNLLKSSRKIKLLQKLKLIQRF